MKSIIVNLLRPWYQKYAKNKLSKNKEVWKLITRLHKNESSSTGCQYSDYWILYSTVRNRKPLEVLECGSGVSTLIIAQALKENEKETGKRGRITSMEELPVYFEEAKSLIPDDLLPYIDLRLSDTEVYGHMHFRGMKYSQVPDREYEFIFIDGPSPYTPDKEHSCDMDLLYQLKKSKKPIYAVIDNRRSTQYVIDQVLPNRFSSNPLLKIGYLAPSTSGDMQKPKCTTHRKTLKMSI